ncbi:hypothetical protein [Thermoactinomyces mirandus]|uniref:Uncharacterized protein n=1 Tax=Thermoactinomyces mirandus TaxID=2756294 RepID=A0A7W2AR39_9BACL|nr:hypothetical protein [Thermoactinomyces mirandus]MBA4602168.1 hypothetical protein [Thermoactinomyces mirandus]
MKIEQKIEQILFTVLKKFGKTRFLRLAEGLPTKWKVAIFRSKVMPKPPQRKRLNKFPAGLETEQSPKNRLPTNIF